MSDHHSREQASSTTLSVGAAGIDRAPVIALAGEEEIGRPSRLEVTFAARDVDAAAVVGASARLVLGRGGPVRGGVIAELEQGEALGDGRSLHRATLVPRAWLLSRGRTTRVFERLSAPEIIELVVAGSGLDVRVDARLRDAYPARPCTVQHRESDLDFLLRIAERDGIAVRIEDDGERCVVALTDHNEALPDAGPLADASGLRCRTALLPRRVELSSADPARPELPLRASAMVSETGAGELTIYDLPFSTPEEGERAARLHAERLRSTATLLQGVSRSPVSAGSRVSCAGRALLVVSARHTLTPEAGWISKYSAIPAETRFRPERRAAAPRAFGLLGGRLSPREPGQDRLSDGEGRYRVRELAGEAERIMPLAGGGAFERELTEGAQVVWGCLDGDPERPVITAVLPGSAATGRAVVRGPGGSVFEIGGAAIPGLGEVEGSLHRLDDRARGGASVPAVAHHADTEQQFTFGAGAGSNDTWMRFAVPHTDGAWSYVRIGEAAIGKPLQATDSNGNAVTFAEGEATGGPLALNCYDDAGLAGSFDFTSRNRTVLTKGNWEHVVDGEGRMKIARNFELDVTGDLVKGKNATPTAQFTAGWYVSGVGGLSSENTFGTKVETTLGGRVGVQVGCIANFTAGYAFNLIHADSYEIRHGEELSDATTIDKRASEKLQLSVFKPNYGGFGPDALLGLAASLAGTASGVAAGFMKDNPGLAAGALTGASAAIVLLGIAVARKTSGERELTDGNPILSLDKGNALKGRDPVAALRSDDWLLMMSPDWAVLGKNKKYTTQQDISKLEMDDTGTGILLEEKGKLTVQAGKDGTDHEGNASATKWARVLLDKQAITICGDTVTISPTAAGGKAKIKLDGDVEITGNLKVKGTLTVDGATSVKKFVAGTKNVLTAD